MIIIHFLMIGGGIREKVRLLFLDSSERGNLKGGETLVFI